MRGGLKKTWNKLQDRFKKKKKTQYLTKKKEKEKERKNAGAGEVAQWLSAYCSCR